MAIKQSVKDRLLEKSLKVFADCGFDGTTTRMIANEANANIASISYYYGGKENLYKSALEHIATEISKINTPIHNMATTALSFADHESAKKILTMMLNAIVESSLKEDMEIFTMILAKELTKPSPYFDIVFDMVTSKTLNLIIKCLNVVRPDIEKNESIIIAQNLLSCAMILRTHKQNIFRALDKETFDSEIIDNQKAVLKTMIEAVCKQPH